MYTSNLKTKIIFIAIVYMVLCISVVVKQAPAGQQTKNQLYLVSIGVGDTDLITLRAINTIRASDVIVCRKEETDRFAEYIKGKEILDGSQSGWRSYRKICTEIADPKERAKCIKSKDSRDKLISQMRSANQAGKKVSVLGSGDLMIYGGPYRWYLEEFQDLNPKVIPGVSCFNASNAAIGKDIMSGKESHSAILTTYREIENLSIYHPTMIIFTMHTGFETLVEKLKTQYPPETPIAIVFFAGYKEKEHIIRGRLDNILQKTQNKKFPFEHLVYIGDFMM
ncbi:MAG: tetrapyrrole methylase [Proteobacteria bacterium]|nr:tetrapyrrole methylase [Pseudomonadota bacterium]